MVLNDRFYRHRFWCILDVILFELVVIIVGKDLDFAGNFLQSILMFLGFLHRKYSWFWGAATILIHPIHLSVENENEDIHIAHLRQLYRLFKDVSLPFAFEVGATLLVLDHGLGPFPWRLLLLIFFLCLLTNLCLILLDQQFPFSFNRHFVISWIQYILWL